MAAVECPFRSGQDILTSDRQGFDRRWFAKNLERVYTPTTADEAVAAANEFSKRYQHDEVQITCGRHCYENFVYNEKTKCIVDVTGLRAFGIDKEIGYYIEVGNNNWDMYVILNNVFGRTLPAGSCYSVGLGGHITGGGYGFLSRLHGLTIDWLTGADIVVLRNGSAELIHCSENQDPDLFWAIRGGGGGNFGIITRYYFKELPRSPEYLYYSLISIPWEDENGKFLTSAKFYDIMSTFAEYECSQSNETWAYYNILHVNHRMTKLPMTLASVAYYDSTRGKTLEAFEKTLKDDIKARRDRYKSIAGITEDPPMLLGHPWLGHMGLFQKPAENQCYRRYTYLEGCQALNGSGPNRYGKYKSAYHTAPLTKDQTDACYTYMSFNEATRPSAYQDADLSASLFQIDSYGCKINRPAPDATAIPQRSSIMKFQYQSYWLEDSDDWTENKAKADANIKWLNDMYSEVYKKWGGVPGLEYGPDSAVEGCYFNYCDNDLGVNNSTYSTNGTGLTPWMLYYGWNNLMFPHNGGLIDIKQRWNPDNWFASPQSLPLWASKPNKAELEQLRRKLDASRSTVTAR
jgi:hypothetical protein